MKRAGTTDVQLQIFWARWSSGGFKEENVSSLSVAVEFKPCKRELKMVCGI